MVKKKKNLKKNVLITGGSGFIGSAITEYIVKNKFNAIVFDNNSRGNLRRLSKIRKKLNLLKEILETKENYYPLMGILIQLFI